MARGGCPPAGLSVGGVRSRARRRGTPHPDLVDQPAALTSASRAVAGNQEYPFRNGSGSIGLPDDHTTSNWLLALIFPIKPVFEMWWFVPSTTTVPSGASKLIPSETALILSTSNEPAF